MSRSVCTALVVFVFVLLGGVELVLAQSVCDTQTIVHTPVSATAEPSLPPYLTKIKNGVEIPFSLETTYDGNPDTGYAPDGWKGYNVELGTEVTYLFDGPVSAERFVLENDAGSKPTEGILRYHLSLLNSSGVFWQRSNLVAEPGFSTNVVEFGEELSGIVGFKLTIVAVDTTQDRFQGQWSEVSLVPKDVLPCCGDGVEQPGEQCDDGNDDDDDACRNDCTVPICTPDPVTTAGNLMLVLDRTGSMGDPHYFDDDGFLVPFDPLKRDIALNAVNEIATIVYRKGSCSLENGEQCDLARIGLASFSTNPPPVIHTPPVEDFLTVLPAIFEEISFGGATPLGEALMLLPQMEELKDTSRRHAAVVITDGIPNSPDAWTAVVDSIASVCELSQREVSPVKVYILGALLFGDAPKQLMSYIAAAGGTGECCEGLNCDFKTTFDPCVNQEETLRKVTVAPVFDDILRPVLDPEKVTCRSRTVETADIDDLAADIVRVTTELTCK